MRAAANLLFLLVPTTALVTLSPGRAPHARAAVTRRDDRPAVSARSRSLLLSAEIVPGVGEGRELPSPSGINTYPLPLQAATVLGISAAIGLLFALIDGPLFDAARGSFLPWIACGRALYLLHYPYKARVGSRPPRPSTLPLGCVVAVCAPARPRPRHD